MTRAVLASLCLALIACGGDDDDPARPDAGRGTDAAPGIDAAAFGPISLTVTINGEVVEGAHVFFSHPDGTVAGQGLTDADGRFAGEVWAGSSATAVVEVVEGHRVVHFTGVEPGDELRAVIGDRWDGLGDPDGVVTANLPGPFDAATLYAFQNGCLSYTVEFGDGSPDVPFYPGCTDDIRLLAYARDNSNNLLAFSGAPATGLGTTVDLPAWRTDWDSVEVTATGASAETDLVVLQMDLMAAGHRFRGPPQADLAPDENGQVVHLLEFAADFFDSVAVDVMAQAVVGERYHYPRIVQRAAAPPASLAVDLGADLLPIVSDIAIAADGIEWSAPPAADAADGLVVGTKWGEEPEAIWLDVVVPASARAIQFPEPAEGLPVAPFPAAAASSFYYSLIEADFLAGYDQLRQSSDVQALAPATGDYVLRTTGGE